MNFNQKLGLFLLIIISLSYVYFSFFKDGNYEIQVPKRNDIIETPDNHFIPTEKDNKIEEIKTQKVEPETKTVKIFVSDSKGNLRSVNRVCNTSKEHSCFAFAISELISAPTQWEKSKGFSSEIPQGTKILSIREGSGSIMIDLSPTFETGGGTESTYLRIRQLIKTAKANSELPVYLYINGKQANVIGGEGIMIKQPLNERSLDD